MRDYIILNGVNSNTITGLLISTLPPITKPKIRTQTEEIDGRDGDIVTKLGYSAYDKEIEIGLYGDFDINEVISYFNSEGTVTFSNEPDKYYNYQILDQIDYEKLIRFKTAKIKMHVQPFKYPLEETPVEITVQTVNNEAEEMDLDNTKEAPMQIDLKGNTSQDGTPTPDAPVDISVVSGDNTIEVVGKNLANLTTDTQLPLSANTTIIDFGEDRTFSAITTSFILKNAKYTNNTGALLSYQKNDGTHQYRTCPQFRIPVNTEVTDTYSLTETNITFRKLTIFTYSAFTQGTMSVQVEKGSSTTEYQEYKSASYPISLGVGNLFDKNTITSGYRLDSLGNLFADSDYFTSDYIEVEPSTQYTTNVIPMNTKRTCEYNSSKTFITNKDNPNTNTITTTSATKYIRVVGLLTELDNTKVAKGTTTDYVVDNPIELCKIGTYQDYIYKENGKWYIEKSTNKVTLNGTEAQWQMYGSSGQRKWYLTSAYFGDNKPFTNTIDKSNKFIVSQYISGAWTNNRFGWHTSANAMIFDTNFGDSLEEWKIWLGNNNVIVYYALQTPTTTEITDATLIAQLEALANATSYDTKTHITQNANDKPFILNATAIQKGSGEAIVNNEGNVYSKPTLDIEGSGTVGIYLDGNQIFTIDLSNSSECVIDTTQLEAYNPSTNELMNRQVTGDYSNFKLNAGDNQIQATGDITKVTISNYTRWL